MEGKALDQLVLRDLADRTRGHGTVCDLGCGPGQVTAFLANLGIDVCGLDISAGMLAQARILNPTVSFHLADILNLPGNRLWIGIAAFYSIVHFTREQLREAFHQMARSLMNSGWLLVAFHTGNGRKHVDELFGVPVDMDFVFFEIADVISELLDAGFHVERIFERAPYLGAEYPSRRGYILASNTAR